MRTNIGGYQSNDLPLDNLQELLYKIIEDSNLIVKDLNLDVMRQKFEIECELTFSIRKSQSEQMQSIFALNHKVKLVYQKTI